MLDDDEVMAGECAASRPEVERLAAGGLLPPDLQALADAALQRYQQGEDSSVSHLERTH